jgi:predicted small secreted protein
MKKISVMAVALAAGVFVLSSCNGKSNGAGGDADSTKVDSVKMSSMGSWDYPEGSALQNPDDISCVLYASSYNSSMKKNEDPAETTHIFYKADFVKAGETKSTIKSISEEYEIPNSLIIPFYKGAKAKKGDIVLTWWQGGSGMQRAIVVDDARPEEPKVCYLDLNFKGDGTGLAEKEGEVTLKPNSFAVIEDGKWVPGANLVVNDGTEQKEGTLLNVAGDKVLYDGFAGKVKVAKKSDCQLVPVKQSLKAGDAVKAVWVGSWNADYSVVKVDEKVGRVWVKDKNGREEIKSVLEVLK